MKPEGIDVRLGEHEYRVRPQRHAYLKRELRKFLDSLSQLSDVEASDLLDVVTAKSYTVLKVFIPDLMDEYEFEGYASADAMKRDAYNEDDDRSPTPPEIKAALGAAMTVNDFDWLGQLKNFIGPDLIRAQIRSGMANWAATQASQIGTETKTNSSKTSQSSPPQNGASVPESSGTTNPTSPTLPAPTSA